MYTYIACKYLFLVALLSTARLALTRGCGGRGGGVRPLFGIQFHSNFFGKGYPNSYKSGLRETQIQAGHVPPTGCPAGRHWRRYR